jgi:hypothetical protein
MFGYENEVSLLRPTTTVSILLIGSHPSVSLTDAKWFLFLLPYYLLTVVASLLVVVILISLTPKSKQFRTRTNPKQKKSDEFVSSPCAINDAILVFPRRWTFFVSFV